MTQIDKYTSDKLRIISFISIILVLYIHSGFHNIPEEIYGMKVNFYLQEAISEMLGRTAVPMFFMISGMLFFRNINSLKDVLCKIKKRARTLLVPFLIAALFLPMVYLIMEKLPWTAKFVNGKDLFSHIDSVWYVFFSLYLFVPGDNHPWGFHLWFLRDLIAIVGVSPILYFTKEKIGKVITTTALFVLTFIPLNFSFFQSLFWFMAGDLLLMKLSKIKSWGWIILYIIISTYQMLMPSNLWSYFIIPITMIGIMSLWYLYDYIIYKNFNLNNYPILAMACKFTFFIYLYHEPTINILRKLMIIPLGRTSLSFAVNYLLSPWIFVIISIPIGILMKKHIPNFYRIIVGGR